MKKLLLAGSVIALTSGAAFAADLAPAPVEPVAPVYVPYSWTGFYVGAQAGYAWANTDIALYRAVPPRLLAGRTSSSPDGGFGGGFAGYNYQFEGNYVLGAEADFNGSDINATDPLVIPGAGVIPAINTSSKMDWFGSVRLRAGYAFDRFLPFITGGYAFGHLKNEVVNTVGPIRIPADDTMSGWTIGAGLEYAITDHILARVEYRYTDYGNKDSLAHNNLGVPGILKRDFKTNDVRVGVSYKF